MSKRKVTNKVTKRYIKTYHFRLSFPDGDLQNECQQHQAFAASRIVDSLVSHYKHKKENLRQQHFKAKARLAKELPATEFKIAEQAILEKNTA